MGDNNMSATDILVKMTMCAALALNFEPVKQRTFLDKYREPVTLMLGSAIRVVIDNLNEFYIEEITKLKADMAKLNKKAPSQPVTSRPTSGQPTLSYSSLFTKSKSSESEVVLVAKVQNELKNKAKIENNVIVSGLPVKDVDGIDKSIEELSNGLPMNLEKVKRAYRLKRSHLAAARAQNSPELLVIEFIDTTSKATALDKAKGLRMIESLKKVFINPDKTVAERKVELELRRLRNEKNLQLPHTHSVNGQDRRYGVDARSGKKFFWGISGQKLVKFTVKEDDRRAVNDGQSENGDEY
jgi:hypothetical protein